MHIELSLWLRSFAFYFEEFRFLFINSSNMKGVFLQKKLSTQQPPTFFIGLWWHTSMMAHLSPAHFSRHYILSKRIKQSAHHLFPQMIYITVWGPCYPILLHINNTMYMEEGTQKSHFDSDCVSTTGDIMMMRYLWLKHSNTIHHALQVIGRGT